MTASLDWQARAVACRPARTGQWRTRLRADVPPLAWVAPSECSGKTISSVARMTHLAGAEMKPDGATHEKGPVCEVSGPLRFGATMSPASVQTPPVAGRNRASEVVGHGGRHEQHAVVLQRRDPDVKQIRFAMR